MIVPLHTSCLGCATSYFFFFFFFSSRRRHTRLQGDWSSDVCSSDLLSRASAVGLPQPSDAATASAGSSDVSPHAYRFDVMGSRSPRDAALSQHEASPPAVTRSAALPYLSLTTSFRSFSAIAVSSYQERLICADKKRDQSQHRVARTPLARGLMAATADSISAIAPGSRQ